MTARRKSARVWWLGVGALAASSYLYSLDGLYIPHIGDEAPYIEIARLTAESGDWLPLRTAPGLENTKPPLLYWMGIAATERARAFTLWRLRAPIVLATFLVAGLVFWVARRVGGGDRETAWVASLTVLGFYSSFQYGRPFLTNMPETLFVFLAFALVLVGEESRYPYVRWGLAGLSLGVACLFKTFLLVVPVGLALGWYLLMVRRWDLRRFIRTDVPRIMLASMIALGCFALWPLFDPHPEEILRHFVLEENLGKLERDGYLRGLFAGAYPLHRLWLGHLGNAGLFALPLLYLVIVSFRRRKRLSMHEKGLWVLVLSFLLVYSLPSQRQENYLIPTVPALAILLALRWREIDARWFRGFNLPGVLVLAGLCWLMVAMGGDVLPPGSHAAWQWALPFAVLLGWIVITISVSRAPETFHALVFLSYLSLAAALAPFEGEVGRFDPERVAALEGRRVYVPESFIRRHERHRFLLPGARIERYDPLDTVGLTRLLESGRVVVVHRGIDDHDTGPFRVLARRLDLSTRHTLGEMWRIATRRDFRLLVRQELVVRRFHPARENRP